MLRYLTKATKVPLLCRPVCYCSPEEPLYQILLASPGLLSGELGLADQTGQALVRVGGTQQLKRSRAGHRSTKQGVESTIAIK